MSVRQLIFSDGSSNKFWNIELNGDSHTVNFGRVGTNGQTKTKEFETADAAQKSFDRLVAEKRKKGYVDASGAANKTAQPATGTSSKTTTKSTAPAPTAEIDLEITHEIDLDPQDWFLASYRKRDKLDRGKPPSADVDVAAEQLAGLKTSGSVAPSWSNRNGDGCD